MYIVTSEFNKMMLNDINNNVIFVTSDDRGYLLKLFIPSEKLLRPYFKIIALFLTFISIVLF